MAKPKYKARKPFSEMSRAEKIAECKGAIERLTHPHNRYSTTCQQAARGWRETLAKLESEA